MARNLTLCSIILACLIGSGMLATDVSLTVHPDRVLDPIDERAYGHFLEHI